MTIRITPINPHASGNPPGKLADAELHFPCLCHPERLSPCSCGPLAGLKLVGFSVWADPRSAAYNAAYEKAEVARKAAYDADIARGKEEGYAMMSGDEAYHQIRGPSIVKWQAAGPLGAVRTVTFPARQYSVNGKRRSFALLRPIVDAAAQERLRELILDAYAETE